MSGMEVVAVLGCVAAVVSAYKDGGKIVKQIKAKRAAKKALAPTQTLESSLERGPIAVEQAKDNGIERYGSNFATGDRIATEALRNIIIELQGTLLRHLWSVFTAQENDEVTDFNILVDVSDFGRIQSVTVLNDLYMRMAQAAPLQQDSRFITPATPSQQVASQILAKSPTLALQSLPLEDPVPKKNSLDSTRRKWGIFPSRGHKIESEIAAESLTSGSIHESTLNDSLLGIQYGGNVLSEETLSSRVKSTSPGFLADGAVASSPWNISSDLSIDEENPWREEPSSLNGDIENVSSPKMSSGTGNNVYMQRRQSTEATLVQDPPRPSREPKPMRRLGPPKPRKQLVSEALPVAESRTPPQFKEPQKKFPFIPRRRNAPDVPQEATPAQTHNLTPTISLISRTQTNQSSGIGSRNAYGGYCKGAYKMQVNLDKESVNLRNQSTSMTGQSNYWACASSKCAFEGPACKNGKNWMFDDTVRAHSAVQYRWTFLAKCHVALSRVKNGEYDYQCVFCGIQPSLYRGEQAFIEHVSEQHRGQQPDPAISEKIRCIYGRVALEEEEFDVNLTPREDLPLVHRQVFVDTPDPITGPGDDDAALDDGVFEWPAIEDLSSTSHR